MKLGMKSILLAISLSLFFLVFFSGCIEETPVINLDMIYVDDDGNADCTSIQDAVDDASDGDTIFVYAGVYQENVFVNKSINITGEDSNRTVIDGGSSGDVLYLSADWVNISGFTIQNGGDRTSFKGQGQDADAGIDVRSNNSTISNNEIMSNDAGCGIYVYDSNNNIVMNNYFSNNNYGIYTYRAVGNNISGNDVLLSSMYGIYLYTGSDENVIYFNTIYDNNYGIRIKGSKFNEIYGNNIIHNKYGLYFCCSSTNNIVFYNLFANNSIWNADDSYKNKWDNSSIGNYWDDYSGVDADNDGLGDTPYNISEGDSWDNYPLMLTTEVYSDFDSRSPIASFSYSPPLPSVHPATVQFTDLSKDRDGYIVSWFWDFGDGDTSNEQNSMHSYLEGGIYYVALTVTDDDGFTDTETKTISVKNKEENNPFIFKIASPIDGDIVDETVLIAGVAEGEKPIKIVEIRIDSGNWIQADGVDSWRYKWDTTEVDDGVHIIYARSYDGYQYSDPLAIKIYVNNAD